jgi:23S rRNA (uracil1939-C5)-methyltransferase
MLGWLPSAIKNQQSKINKMSMYVGQEVLLDIEKPVLGGHGLARVDGRAVFVEGSLPGERLRARVTAFKSRYAWAESLQILVQSPDFTPPKCSHFGLCGGCDWLHMDYGRQLHWKRELVCETLRHLGGIEAQIAPTIPSPVIDGYRNKMEFAFAPPVVAQRGHTEAKAFVLGLRPREQALHAVAIDSCRLCLSEMWDARRIIEEWALESGLPAYDPQTGQGFWRHAVLRCGYPASDITAIVITAHHPQGRDIGPRLVTHLKQHIPSISALIHEERLSRSLLALGEKTIARIGSGESKHCLGNLELTVSSRSFFQSNTSAAQKLYATIRDLAGLSGRETVWDLYCGVGGIALSLAKDSGRVLGLESTPQAVQDARDNAGRNHLAQCSFLQGDVAKTLKRLARLDSPGSSFPCPDVIVANPPRVGLQREVVDRLLDIKAPKLILVSCNPATLARDVKLLSPDYIVRRVQPVDMFPHTSHIECVVELVFQS